MNTTSGGYAYYSQPVNFGDQPSYNDPYDARTRTITADNSSLNTYQTSGVPAVDTSGKKNEHGQTEAEIVAFDYHRSSPLTPSSSKMGYSESLTRQPSNKSSHRKSFAPSNTDALTYIDEDFNYYPSRTNTKPNPDRDSALLVANAAGMGRKDTRESRAFNDLGMRCIIHLFVLLNALSFAEYQDPANVVGTSEQPNKSALHRFLERGRYPIEQRIEDKKRGIGRQKHPFVGEGYSISFPFVFS